MSAAIEDRNRRIYPPSLQPPRGEDVTAPQLLRPVAFAGTTENSVRTDITDRTGRPLVYLTFGSVFNDKETFRAAATGIRELGVGLATTVGPDCDPGAFGPQPPPRRRQGLHPANAASSCVRHRRLPRRLGHGARRARDGHPAAVLALGCRPYPNAPAVARAAPGLAIYPDEVDAAGVAEGTQRLLEDSCHRQNARRVADQIGCMPSPDEVATVFEAVA